jgi:predicted nucleic acid-binding protein
MINDNKYTFVMDCSVIMSLLFVDEHNAMDESFDSILGESLIIVPTIWFYEVSNVLKMALLKSRISEADLTEIEQIVAALDIEVDEASTRQGLSETLHLAREYKLTAYDAAYLELALRRGVPLATLDKAMRKAAQIAGIEVM